MGTMGTIEPGSRCWCCGTEPLTKGQTMTVEHWGNAYDKLVDATNRALAAERRVRELEVEIARSQAERK